jgi:L-fuculose-phosphate aldolase
VIHAPERQLVAYFMRRLYTMKLTTTSGGNVSVRAGDDRLAVTASATDKATASARQVPILSLDGENLTPELTPSSEASMHLRIYQEHPHIKAICHAHPPTLAAFVCSDAVLRLDLVAETYVLVEEPVVVPYLHSGSTELADAVAEAAGRSSSILMRNHAVTTTGETLLQAFNRLELLEDAARLSLTCAALPGVEGLPCSQRRELDEKYRL